MGMDPTTLSGTVYAPNGTLKLYGVDVYVPKTDPGEFAEGVQCTTCEAELPGGALVQTKTNEAGHFVLENVPATTDVPLVIQIGKWRRRLTVPNVTACQKQELADEDIRLPKDRTEGDIPHIAISTGAGDALECLALRLGIAPSEFTIPTKDGRVHLYTNEGAPLPSMGAGRGTDRFNSTWVGGADDHFGDSQTLWASTTELDKYDIVMLSCEGNQYPDTKPQTALEALKAYADAGGRVFMSHWHNIWIGGEQGHESTHGIPEWREIADWDYPNNWTDDTQLDIVDQTVPAGLSFAVWLVNVGASTIQGERPITTPRYTCQGNTTTKSERWVYVDPTKSTPPGRTSVQDLLFTTPQDKPTNERCGKVVFSDMHVASGSTSGAGDDLAFPNGCSTDELTPQEKALAFIFFDISSWAGPIVCDMLPGPRWEHPRDRRQPAGKRILSGAARR
jgi:hypothetical protein